MDETRTQQASFAEILAAKDERATVQAEMRQRHNLPVVSVSVNMAGAVKYSDDTVSILYFTLSVLRSRLQATGVVLKEERLLHAVGGPSAILAVDGGAAALKRAGIDLEEQLACGRIIDIDVLDADGRQISRTDLGLPPRTCMLCPNPAAVCVRSAAHDREDVLTEMQRLIIRYRAEATRLWPPAVEIVGSLALEAMLMEVSCTPAPGLVDRVNSGAHSDMDIFTFLTSSSVLAPALFRCALAGLEHGGRPGDLLPVLRCIGVEGEKGMFAATGGVNTQKGLLFLLGVLAAATTSATRVTPNPKAADIAALVGAICQDIVERELAGIREQGVMDRPTAGERLYLQHGITGIRGEMAAGLPAIMEAGLPFFRSALADRLPLNDALVHTLIALMTVTQDTTIVNRHGMATLLTVQKEAAAIMAAGGMMTDEGCRLIEDLDQAFIRRNISPGGAADLLAATYFLQMVEDRLGSSGI